jgi:hypothetical protein
MKISVLLIDWSVRESFHAIEYLNRQDVPRDQYELIWIEHFSRRHPALDLELERGRLDRYVVQGHTGPHYAKHDTFNAGALVASGDVLVLPDSDAMFQPSFIRSIQTFFNEHPENAFLLLDEARNTDPSYWPFRFPDWDEVLHHPATYNWDAQHGVTKPLAPDFPALEFPERLFYANYGACFAMKRRDFIRFGGLDEHETYIGFVCGVYELVLRLVNAGFEEHWHRQEFLLHTWHPWIKPGLDVIGPNIRNFSTTSLKHVYDDSWMPLVESPAIRQERIRLFGEGHQFSEPEISYLVLDVTKELSQRVYDSAESASTRPFEVVFANGHPGEVLGANARRVNVPFPTTIRDALAECRGDWCVLLPKEALLRRGALDRALLAASSNRSTPWVLQSITTHSQGYYWEPQGPGADLGSLPILLQRDAFEAFLGGRDAQGPSWLPSGDVHAELWMPVSTRPDESHHRDTYDHMIDLKHSILYDQQAEAKLGEACSLLNTFCSWSPEDMNAFLQYCLMARFNLTEFYRFIGVFRTHALTTEIRSGMGLLTGAKPLLEKYGGPHWRDQTQRPSALRYNDLMVNDLAYYVGIGHFHLGRLDAQAGLAVEAVEHLTQCLIYIPDHREGLALLLELQRQLGQDPPTMGSNLPSH